MENKLINSFGEYFNNILKNTLGYKETFTVKVNLNDKIISLISNYPSQLINMLRSNPKLTLDLKTKLQFAFMQNNPDIEFFELTILNNHNIRINYGFNVKSLKDADVYAIIAKDFSIEDLQNFCNTDSLFNNFCKQDSFWRSLFKMRYDKIPTSSQNINYRTLYTEVDKYLRLLKEKTENLSNKLSKNVFFSRSYVPSTTVENSEIISLILYDELVSKESHKDNSLDMFSRDTILYLADNNLLNLEMIPLIHSKYIFDGEVISRLSTQSRNICIIINQILLESLADVKYSRYKDHRDKLSNKIRTLDELSNMLRMVLFHQDGKRYITAEELKDCICRSFNVAKEGPHMGTPFDADNYKNIFSTTGIGRVLESYIRKGDKSFDIRQLRTSC